MTDQPPTWAGRSVPSGDAGPPPEEKRRTPLVPILATGALVLVVGGAGFWLGRSDSPSDETLSIPSTTIEVTTSAAETSVPTTEATSETSETTDTTVDAAAAEAEAAATAEAEAAAAAAEAAAAAAPDVEASIEEGDVRAAVLKGGQLYLGGEVPSREVADLIIERAAAVVGAENIVDQYVVNPDAPVPAGAPLYVEDVVLFAYGSDEIDPAFVPLLELGVLLLTQNPQVTVTVISHTDADGSADFNMALSERRGAAVADYWIAKGINADQIKIEAKGESEPVGDNDTDDGASANRRAEFFIEGLLG